MQSTEMPNQHHLHKAMVFYQGTTITMMGHGPILTPSSDRPKGLTALGQTPFTVTWHFKTQVIGKLSLLCQDLANEYGFAVSDGSFKECNGVAAWIIEGPSGANRLLGTCLTPGAPEDQSAFRSKLTGLYRILLTLHFLFLDKGTPTPLVISCDGKLTLMQAKSMDPLLPSKPHYDLILAIRKLTLLLPFSLQWRHIHGHQDGKTITALPWEAWLNIMADTAEKATLDISSQASNPTQYEIPFSSWVCYVGTNRVVKQLFECT